MTRLAMRETTVTPVVVRGGVSRETCARTEIEQAASGNGAGARLSPVAAGAESVLSEKAYWHPLSGPAPTD